MEAWKASGPGRCAASVGSNAGGTAPARAIQRPVLLHQRAAALDALLRGERRLRGRVKSWSEAKGFGFLACAEVESLLACDVFLHRSEEAESAKFSVGAQVSFQLRLREEDGKPQARSVVVEDKCEPPALRMGPVAIGKVMFDKTYLGSIKSFNQEKGFGFIACNETFRVFGRDVFVQYSKLCGLAVGEAVRFRISIDPVKGTPRCREVEREASRIAVGAASANGFAALKGLGQQPRRTTPAGATVVEDAVESVALDLVRLLERESSSLAEDQDVVEPAALDLSGLPERESSSPAEDEEPWAGWEMHRRPQHCMDACTGEQTDATSDRSTLQPSDAASIDAASSEGASPGVKADCQIPEEGLEVSCLEPATSAALDQEAGRGPASDLASGAVWQQYLSEDGHSWWYREPDGDWFWESSPGPWAKYYDPDSGRAYWWKADDRWFWI